MLWSNWIPPEGSALRLIDCDGPACTNIPDGLDSDGNLCKDETDIGPTCVAIGNATADNDETSGSEEDRHHSVGESIAADTEAFESFDQFIVSFTSEFKSLDVKSSFTRKAMPSIRDVMRPHQTEHWEAWTRRFHSGTGDPALASLAQLFVFESSQ